MIDYLYRGIQGVNMFILASGNPFISAYLQSDFFGRCVFWGLFFLSGISWSVLIHKSWMLFRVRKSSAELSSLFCEKDPLGLQVLHPVRDRFLEVPHPFFEIYKAFKQKALAIISRNHMFASDDPASFSESDMGLLEAQLQNSIGLQMKKLEKNLFVLSTAVTLGPFVGLLGTVWGILMTFSQMSERGMHAGSGSMLAGLSLALAATVIGLVVAIPALIGHNYLKNGLRELRRDMEDFSCLLLGAIELHYRKVTHAPKATFVP